MSPIAVFDSGYGGLSVLKSIRKRLPEYDYIYLGDNARAPYGNRSFSVIYQYTRQAVKFLFDQGAHLVILACNTASAKALRTIQQKDLPLWDTHKRVLGVIRPSVEAVGEYSHTHKVGVLGTIGTINSQSYIMEINKLHNHLDIFQHACPMWVPLVENNEHRSAGADYFIQKDLAQIFSQSSDIDTLLLACTHYPLLIDKIQQYVPSGIKIISQGEIVAEKLADYLIRHPEIEQKCSKNGKIKFFTTEEEDLFSSRAEIFFGKKISASKICIDK